MNIIKEEPKEWKEQKNIKFLFEARERPIYKIFFLVEEGFYKNMIGFVDKTTIKKGNFTPRAQNFFVKDLTNLYKRKFYSLGAILLDSYSGSGNNLHFMFFRGKYKGLKGCITPESFQRENVSLGWNSLTKDSRKKWIENYCKKNSINIVKYPKDFRLTQSFSVEKNGIVWNTTVCNFQQRHLDFLWYKAASKGEVRIKNFLKKENIEFIYQKRFYHEDLSYQIFDFFLPNLNLAIEYNGEQHYIENNFFATSLAEQKRSDKRKELYCKKNNIELLIIPYWEYNKIEEILKGVVSNGLYS